MEFALIYLAIGLVNCAAFWRGFSSPVEVVFYLLLWPTQILWLLFVGISNITDWIGNKLMG